jgi:Lon protease-like protein
MSSNLQIADLPATIHLLPIDRFLLLPETRLPLTVTSPRGQEILDAAELASGYVGVIQTRPKEERAQSRYYAVGGLGRIARLERDEAGHHVTIEGVIRFRVREELPGGEDDLPQAAVAYDEFEHDLAPPEEDLAGWNLEGMRDALLEISRRQSGRDKTPLESMNAHQLVRVLAQTIPMAAAEKQVLLETRSFRELLELLFQLLAVNYLTTTPDASPSPRAN